MRLTINICPYHAYYSVGVDHEDGTGSRLTTGKCCGQWETVKSWWMSAEDWERVAKIARRGASDARKLEKRSPQPEKKSPIRKKAAGRRRGRR